MVNFILGPELFGNPKVFLLYKNNILSLEKTSVVDCDEVIKDNPEMVYFENVTVRTKFEELYKVKLPTFPPEKYAKAYRSVMGADLGVFFSWEKCMPRSVYYNALVAFAEEYSGILEKLNLSYWFDIFPRISTTISHLQTFVVNKGLLTSLLQTDMTSNKEILKTFEPVFAADYCFPPKYTLTGTRTGRLKVVSGPNILSLKKDYRKIIGSTFGNEGKLWYLDYASLEPRVLLLTNPLTSLLIGSVPQRTASRDLPLDIYTKALSDLNLEGQVPRSVAKTAILSAIYGQSEEATADSLRQYVSKPEDFVAAIGDYFGIGKLKQKLSEDLAKTNGKYIYNLYGRPIVPDDAKPYALLNYYIQSTAVDVALLGFGAIINRLREYKISDMVRPILILHDALILDIHKDLEYVIPKLEKLGSTGILKFKQENFFLQASEL
ncbi:MAG: DNA polymerase [Candidatus Paceibacterota bacterium]|jgi:hypothetical protein